jgi:hypothetical protein
MPVSRQAVLDRGTKGYIFRNCSHVIPNHPCEALLYGSGLDAVERVD